jgi:amino acid transporter
MLKSPLFFATCMFGITFTILENTAGSSVSFATSILTAANVVQTPGNVIAIALGANTFCCLLHALSRKWGVIINNVFGTIKVLLLIFIVIVGFVWLNLNRDTARHNFDVKNSLNFDNSPKLPYRYAEAMIYIILPYGAFHQINYVSQSRV